MFNYVNTLLFRKQLPKVTTIIKYTIVCKIALWRVFYSIMYQKIVYALKKENLIIDRSPLVIKLQIYHSAFLG